MAIRRATMDDTRAICNLFKGTIERWQRMANDGSVQDVSYDDLSIHERWLHGGAWLSIETAVIWLNYLLRHDGLPLVYDNGRITGYVEAYAGVEQAPFGTHLHIGKIVTTDDAIRDDFMQYLIDHASEQGRITASALAYDENSSNVFKRYGMKAIEQVQQLSIRAVSGNVGFYKVSDHLPDDIAQIASWQMPIGRTESAAYHWQHLWANHWQAFPNIITARRTHRQKFNVGGQESFVCLQQQLYNTRAAHIYCWTPKKLSSQLMAAIRDWAYKQGYRTLNVFVNDTIAKSLDSEAETMPQQHLIFARDT